VRLHKYPTQARGRGVLSHPGAVEGGEGRYI